MRKRLLLLMISCCVFSSIGCGTAEKDGIESKIDNDVGEGAPIQEAIDITDAKEYEIGDTIKISSENVSYELTIDGVSYIEHQNEHTEEPDHVVLVDYTYKSDQEDPLLIGDMRFQLTASDNEKVYEPYYYDSLITADLAEQGQSISAQIAFAQDDDSKELLLIYRDTLEESVKPVYIRINILEEE